MAASQPVAGKDIGDGNGEEAGPEQQHHKIEHVILTIGAKDDGAGV
jgi:hypothetical protein